MRDLKKLAAIVMATIMITIGSGLTRAYAITETVEWHATDNNTYGVPESASVIGYAYMGASSDQYTGTVTKMSDITNRSLTLSSSSHTMTTGKIVYNNTGSRTWRLTGYIGTVEYKMVANTSLSTLLYVEGKITR